jgi:hypothetical protein
VTYQRSLIPVEQFVGPHAAVPPEVVARIRNIFPLNRWTEGTVATLRLDGWMAAPRLGVVVPAYAQAGWADAAFWCAFLEAWGYPFERINPLGVIEPISTLVVPARTVDATVADSLAGAPRTILAGAASPACSGLPSVRFPYPATALDRNSIGATVRAARSALAEAAWGTGLVSIWPWPQGKRAALVIDGDVDHPSGVEPSCSRYVAPSVDIARRAGFGSYGIFVAAQNIEAEPGSFPGGVEYYNHSFSHPYSHWNPEPWASLKTDEMRQELVRAGDVYRDLLRVDDRGMFRLPHFQLDAWDRTADVLEELDYRGESSIGSNVSVTDGLPFHPSRRPWSARAEDAAYARTHPDPDERRPFLQIPISTDPSDPAFPNGCCSYNTLDEGVRRRSAHPEAFEEILTTVVEHAFRRDGLAHLFIDPPDAGYGRLPGDRTDYASAVERFIKWAVSQDDLAIMSIAELVGWWLKREEAIARMRVEIDGGALVVTIEDPPVGTTLEVISPQGVHSFHAMSSGSA